VSTKSGQLQNEVGATTLDSLIQLFDSNSVIEVASIGAQIVSLVPGPAAVITNGVSLVLIGVKIQEGGNVTTVGDWYAMAGSGAAIGAALAAAASLPVLTTALTVVGAGLAVGGLVSTLVDMQNGVQTVVDVNNGFRASVVTRAPALRDPLAIDLDGDGIETIGITATPVLFDHNADGIKTGTGWVKADDAWLALDRDVNGLIDTGR
jgi:hypothetical protein